MNEEIEALGREIRRRRQALGMTLPALAEATGITPNYIGAIELGHRDPSLSTVLRIARGLRLMPGELLGMPELPPDAIEAAKLVSGLPEAVRKPLTNTLRALAGWGGRQP
ncbi:MAG: helix-turn-helix transcriptional regulator [Polyangiaceae bacterium]|nr:helix-turn-helix transcriptional regulator [Polyangiaceae bacterium]